MGNKKPYSSYLNKVITSSFHFELVSEADTSKILQSLSTKNSTGHNGISTKLLKMLAPSIIKAFTLIINQSLITGIFPEKLKLAKVVPLHKKDDTLSMDNYRPVSLLSSISKLFEKVVHIQLSCYFKTHKLLYSSKYGFREDHSTELASLELVDRVLTALDHCKTPVAIYMDLSKAFDTLDHQILIQKLNYYGIRGTALNWFVSYLSNRKQFVVVNDDNYDYQTILTGVPQGSVLGPLLFLIYMNDINEAREILSSILFADDSTFLNSLNASFDSNISRSEFETIFNRELNKIYDWLAVNKLSLNIKKTKFMIFHMHNKKILHVPRVTIANIEIERVHNFNFLGLKVNENLSWKDHSNKIALKLSKFNGVLNRLKHYLPTHILRTLYCSMVQSNLNFSLLAWGFDVSKLEKLQKKIIRTILCSRYNAHTEPLFKTHCLLKIEDLFKLNVLKFYYKFVHGKVPDYFGAFSIISLVEIHGRHTRFNHLVPRNVTRLQTTQKCLRHYLPYVKVTTHSYQGFSNYIKQYIIGNYSLECNIHNCYICNR